jgi:hypothetical protein
VPPLTLPASVRSAQIVVWVMAGLSLLLAFAVGDAEAAGRIIGSNLLLWVIVVLAFLYPTAGNGVRVASLVLAGVQILFALGAAARGAQGGIVPLAASVTVLVLLSRRAARDWFRRPRPGAAPQGPYA